MKKIKKFFSQLTKFWKKRKWLIIIALIILAILGYRWNKAQAELEILTFEKPTNGSLMKTLEISGVVDAKEKAGLRFGAGGKIVYLGAQIGDSVKKWQTIATVDARSALKTKEKNLNLYSKERQDWDQRQDDIGDGLTVDEATQRTINQEQYDLSNTVLDVEIAAITISNSVMSAPFNGVLVSSPVNVTGVNVLATEAFEVVNPETLIFKALVEESDISLIEKNQTVTVELDSYPGETFDTQINYISYKSVAASSGTSFIVEMEIPVTEFGMAPNTWTKNIDYSSALKKYRLGMNGDAEIKLEEKQDVMSIPYVAIRERDGKTFVDIKTGQKGKQALYEEREVEIGLETEDRVEILGGLSESDEVLIPEN